MKVRSVAIIIYLDRLEDVEYVVDASSSNSNYFVFVGSQDSSSANENSDERKKGEERESEQFQMDEIGIREEFKLMKLAFILNFREENYEVLL